MNFNKGISTPLIAAIIAIVFFVGGGATYYYVIKMQQKLVACTEEAKVCPDGSAVGRAGPSCEFVPCPEGTPEWLAIKKAINNCEVGSTMQAHSLEVSAKLKNGGTLRAIEPSIDDIIFAAENAQEKCGKIRMATE